ncbi:MAG: AAA family ATPase, partial [Thermomicrobiales bacterium]
METVNAGSDGLESEDFGVLLAFHRRVANLTQEALSERSGVSVRAIQAIESGKTRWPQAATARMLVTALELPELERQRLLSVNRRRPVPRAAHEHDPILGRDSEIARIEAWLVNGERLVTLLGPGGVGKTRLARAIANRWNEGGLSATWVALESVTDPADVLPEVARALGIGEAGDQSLLERIAGSIDGPGILVIDNLEHLLSATSDIAALLAAAPRFSVLVTSREALRLRGERILLLDPLPLPDQFGSPMDRAANPAVTLFRRALGAVAPDRTAADG